jgi:hypothetical protein
MTHDYTRHGTTSLFAALASFPSNSGSRLNLKLSTRCGCSPYFCQMRWTV